jgi:Caspase domain
MSILSYRIPHTPISPNPDAEFYDMSHLRRGKAYIFNHEKFDNSQRMDKLNRRYGTAKDRDRLAKILTDLLFEVTCFNDLTATCVKEELCLCKFSSYVMSLTILRKKLFH